YDIASKHNIAPGAIALNYAWCLSQERTGNYYALANKALNILHPDARDAQEIVPRKMEEHLPFDNLPDESVHFLRRLTSIEEQRETETAASVA
ncbi:MAG: hypothetical protein BRD45_03465, partial [Bacteroidetes bacterium QS_8_64_10]